MNDSEFLSQLENPDHLQRCKVLMDEAAKKLSKAADMLNTLHIDSSVGRTRYF